MSFGMSVRAQGKRQLTIDSLSLLVLVHCTLYTFVCESSSCWGIHFSAMRCLVSSVVATLLLTTSKAFHLSQQYSEFSSRLDRKQCHHDHSGPRSLSSKRTTALSTRLFALPLFVKKSKTAELKQYVAAGVPEDVMSVYKAMKSKMDTVNLSNQSPGPLQQALTRRAGTLTVIAEYKRKLTEAANGYIDSIYDPELLSPTFREYGAAAIAVTADEKLGGCTYDDLAAFCEEQRRARMEVPGPVLIINNDLILDELQIARTKSVGAAGVVLDMDFLDQESDEQLTSLLKATKACDLEAIVCLASAEQAQRAVDAGARIICVVRVDAVADKVATIERLQTPEGQTICKIASITAQPNKSLNEIEQAWAVRDKGFQSAWLGDVLYKNAAAAGEHPGAVIKACISKSSLKWASPKAASGKGEGAREYLGDILM